MDTRDLAARDQNTVADELERQKQYFESLFAMSPVAIVMTDADTRVTAWNPAATSLFGYTEREALGVPIDDLIANRDELREEAAAVKTEAASTGQFQGITRRTRKDGSLVDVEVRAVSVVVDGELSGYYAIYNDISELQRQKQYYESLLETSPVAIMTVDMDATVTSWNPAAERLLGYTREEAIGRNIDELVAGRSELRGQADEVSHKAARGDPVQLVTRRTRKDGSLIDVDVVAAPIYLAGEQVGFYAIYNDISELQQQKQYYESLLESSPSAIVTVDLDATVRSWNPAAERLFGYTREEAVGQNIDDLVAGRGDLRAEAEDLNREGALGAIHVVTTRTRKDGSLVDVDIVGAPIYVAGEQVGLYAIYSDVGELQRQRRYYESLVEMSPTAIATVDPDDTVTSWNAAAEELFGYSRKEAIGRNIDDIVAKRPDLHEEATSVRGRAAAGPVRLVTRRSRKDGSLVDVELRAARVFVAGEFIGLVALYHDISELVQARQEAEAATQAKSAFLATMSHEIRTPMNAVIGMTELLLGTDLDAEQRSFADVIRTSGEALLSVINDILDFSKIEAGRLDLEDHPFDLRESIESALDLVAPVAAEKGLDLAYVLDPVTPEAVIGDATRLRQVLLNLLNNAVKFTERGEVVLSVDAEPVARGAGTYQVHFQVRDTGIGIPDDQLDTLFESFSQLDASTTRRYGGTGLGLAISRRLTEAMGGTIWAESRVGEGSTFHFTIEAEAGPRPLRRYAAGAAAPLSERRVLIVDDNATNRHIARAYAESWGMVTRDTESPAEALEWIRRGDPFDVAIVDMQMPELDGLAVAREIRQHRDADRLPLILLTSLGRRESEAERLFAASLTKPIRPSQLYDVLLDVLGEEAPVAAPEQVAAPERAREAPTGAALRVLIAEDNTVNQRLALLLLEKLGHRADVVGNGAEALEALEALEHGTYDVILMDVQMPEMDGLEATRRIHERWASKRPRIIAVTAGAMSEERDRCLAAGMDDYLSKPIRIEELSAALGAVAPPQADALNKATVERLAKTLGDGQALSELIDTFFAEAPKLLTALQEAAREGNADELRRTAHTLKANAATFGAERLAELCRRLEAIGEEEALSEAEELAGHAESEYARVRPALEAARADRRAT
jgi:PAS domain S-box-containing protein